MADCTRSVIVIAEDDPDDQLLIREAFQENKIQNPLQFVTNGQELLEFLGSEGEIAHTYCDRPGLILLDLNMPYKNGRDALKEIKSNKKFSLIPIVVLTTSHNHSDIQFCYENGAEGYVTKPSNYHELVERLKSVSQYWLDTVELPE